MECSFISGSAIQDRRDKEEWERSVLNIRFIAQHMENLDSYSEVRKALLESCFDTLSHCYDQFLTWPTGQYRLDSLAAFLEVVLVVVRSIYIQAVSNCLSMGQSLQPLTLEVYFQFYKSFRMTFKVFLKFRKFFSRVLKLDM